MEKSLKGPRASKPKECRETGMHVWPLGHAGNLFIFMKARGLIRFTDGCYSQVCIRGKARGMYVLAFVYMGVAECISYVSIRIRVCRWACMCPHAQTLLRLNLREKLRHVKDRLGSRERKGAPAIRLENNRLLATGCRGIVRCQRRLGDELESFLALI